MGGQAGGRAASEREHARERANEHTRKSKIVDYAAKTQSSVTDTIAFLVVAFKHT